MGEIVTTESEGYLVSRDGELYDPVQAIELLTSGAALERNRALMAARDRAIRSLLNDNDEISIDGKRVPIKQGYQKLARAFLIDTRVISSKGWWDPPDQNGLAHFNAEVVVEGIAPWGQRTTSVRRCTTREDKFGKFEGGEFRPYWKKLQGAENDCTGIAETRAKNAVTDHLIALGKVGELSDTEVEEVEGARDERRQKRDRFDLSQRWQKILADENVDVAAEEALYEMDPRLPNDEPSFAIADYERCIMLFRRRGPELFQAALLAKEDKDVPADSAPSDEVEKTDAEISSNENGAPPIADPSKSDEVDVDDPKNADAYFDEHLGGSKPPSETALRLDWIGKCQDVAKQMGEPNFTETVENVAVELVEDYQEGTLHKLAIEDLEAVYNELCNRLTEIDELEEEGAAHE